MKSLKEYLVAFDMGTPQSDIHTQVMGHKKDVIEITFDYNDKTIVKNIHYSDITHEGYDDKWYAKLKTQDNIEFTVSADFTHTGRVGYSTNNMKIEINGKTIIPDVRIIPYNTFIYGTVSRHTIQI